MPHVSIKKIAGIVLLGGVILFAIRWFFFPQAVPVEVASVQRGLFRELMVSDGYFRSKERYPVSAFADGDIRRIRHRVGDSIKKGDLITELYWDLKWDPVLAPVSGVISKIYREAAGPIHRGETILEIVDPDHLEIVAELLTTDAVRVPIGASALIENWGGSAPLGARVVRVSRAGFNKISALGVEEERTEVILEPLELPSHVRERLGSSYHLDLTLVLAEYPDSLILPMGALFRDPSLKTTESAGGSDRASNSEVWAVYRVVEGRAVLTPVRAGERSLTTVRIQEGLSEHERVVIFPSDRIRDGTRVQELPESQVETSHSAQ
ncbi:MAG: hypothetical protein RJB38_954 [Pseudomonadota bacterium]|jgi:HlyD family secretion protein